MVYSGMDSSRVRVDGEAFVLQQVSAILSISLQVLPKSLFAAGSSV